MLRPQLFRGGTVSGLDRPAALASTPTRHEEMPRRLLLLLATSLALAAAAGGAARAAAPVIIPVQPESSDPWAVTSTTPGTNISINWMPYLAENAPVKAYAVTPGSFVYMIGDTYQDFPIIWDDAGSGVPVPRGLNDSSFQFPLAGEYPYRCQPLTNNVCGLVGKDRRSKIWVVGPRPIIKATMVSADNTDPPVLYDLDASGSFVTDFDAHQIVEYSFDFDDDGTFDQTGTEPYARAGLQPGDQYVTLRVKDDIGRVAAVRLKIQVPKARSAAPTPAPADTSLAGTNVVSGVKFPKANVRVKASKRIKVTALKRKGVVIRVTGLTKGDTVRAKLLNGKKTVGTGRKKATSSSLTVRLKVGSSGRRLLKLKKKVTRMVLAVTASGEDGFSVTKRAALRVTR